MYKPITFTGRYIAGYKPFLDVKFSIAESVDVVMAQCAKLESVNAALLDDQKKLRALEAGGVDNWEGYAVSLENMEN